MWNVHYAILLAISILMRFLKYSMHPFSVLEEVIRIMCRKLSVLCAGNNILKERYYPFKYWLEDSQYCVVLFVI